MNEETAPSKTSPRSPANSPEFKQGRRQWLKSSATALAATLLPLPSGAAKTHTAQAQPDPLPTRSDAPFFNSSQRALIEELSETILPADSRSGGAKAAKVVDYIEHVVGNSADDGQRTLWKQGLCLIDEMTRRRTGKAFVDATAAERVAVFTVLAEHDSMVDLPEVRFFHELKRLTVKGYYTSTVGIHDELEYKGNRLLLEYVGCNESDQGAS